MVDYKIILGSTATLFAFVQYVPYIKDVLAGKTRPHAFSWFVWGLPCGIVLAAQIVEGGGAGAWATAVTTLFCTAIFILSLFRGEKDITKLDWFCLFMALASLVLWGITKDPLWSVILITVSDLLGFIPTMRKSINKPHEETVSTYIMGAVKWVLSLGALNVISLTVWLYPCAMIAANLLAAVLIKGRRRSVPIPT